MKMWEGEGEEGAWVFELCLMSFKGDEKEKWLTRIHIVAFDPLAVEGGEVGLLEGALSLVGLWL